MFFDRFDICEAYAVLEWDFNRGGMLHERPSNQRRNESCGVQLSRLRFKARPSLGGFASLTQNGRSIYRAAVDRLGLGPVYVASLIAELRFTDSH